MLRGSFRAGSGVPNPCGIEDVLEAGQGGTVLGNSEQRVEIEAGVQVPSQAIPLKPEQPGAATGSRCCQAGAGLQSAAVLQETPALPRKGASCGRNAPPQPRGCRPGRGR